MVAADQRQDHAATLDDHRHRLQRRPGRHAQGFGDLIDGGQARGRHLARLVERRRQLDRLRPRRCDLDVGGIAGRESHLVLARRAGRHVLVRARAAHHPDVGLDLIPAQARAVEDPRVGAPVKLVARGKPLLVAVQGVGVLHRELAGAQHAGARARLVAFLDLDVVEDLRQLPVGADLARDVVGERLLVGHREHVRRALAVLELEQLLDLIAPGRLPGLGRLQHRHQHLLAADRVHLLAHDRLRPLDHPVAGRQPRIEPGAELPDRGRRGSSAGARPTPRRRGRRAGWAGSRSRAESSSGQTTGASATAPRTAAAGYQGQWTISSLIPSGS